MSGSKTITFSGKGLAGDLADPRNWAGGVVPGIADTALIKINVGAPIGGTFAVNNMMLLGTEKITFTGTLDTAGVGACQGLMVCDGAEAVFAPGAVLNDGNAFIVGNDAVGTLLAQGSGATHSVINSVSANIGKQDAGVGVVTIDDGVWINSGRALIGDAGVGTVNVIDKGSVTIGGEIVMAASLGSSGTLNIASGGAVTGTGALQEGGTGKGDAVINVGSASSLTVGTTLTVGSGSAIDLAGGTVTAGVTAGGIRLLAGGTMSGFGTLADADGVPIGDSGVIRATGGTLTVAGNVDGSGAVQIAANSSAVLTGASLRMASIAFIGPDATLSLAHGSTVTAAISGFAIGDMIAIGSVDAVSFAAATGILTLSENNAQVETLHLAGSFSGEMFAVHQSAGHAIITLQHS